MKLEKPYAFTEAYDRIREATGTRTQTEVAKLLEIKQSSISDAKGKNTIPDGWLLKLYQKCRLEPEWILFGVGPKSLSGEGSCLAEPYAAYSARTPEVLVYDMAATDEHGRWKRHPQSKIALPDSFCRDALLVVTMDNPSMEPVILRDAYVGLDAAEKTVKSGEIHALEIPGEGMVITRVVRDLENRRLALLSENPAYQERHLPLDAGDYQVLGRAVWVAQRL